MTKTEQQLTEALDLALDYLRELMGHEYEESPTIQAILREKLDKLEPIGVLAD